MFQCFYIVFDYFLSEFPSSLRSPKQYLQQRLLSQLPVIDREVIFFISNKVDVHVTSWQNQSIT